MIGEPIFYQGGYKYRMKRAGSIDLNLFKPFPRLPHNIVTPYVTLSKDGLLWWREGYAWDGCSGPTIDDRTNMRGGAFHDMLYQLMREGLLPMFYRAYADDILRLVCIADGMDDFRGWYYRAGVDLFAEKCATPGYEPYPELEAPGDPALPLMGQLFAGDWKMGA